MSYTALYRKLRPKNFDAVVGQRHIVRTLVNQLNTQKISHAYLFCGTRGTGKTSIAKIFAKAVNCLHPVNGNPCDNCVMCENISLARSMNVIEIDAASNNGVDNIREIREEVKYPPTEGIYKVYIIDEVHMLSIGAFNALLKTLEEPPEHVIFILATTDPQKIPPTIHSRCQRFDFHRISSHDMNERLIKLSQEENITIEEEAINYITQVSDGAMRDALSILDQCTSFYFDEKITVQKVLDIVGSVDNEFFFRITNSIIQKNTADCLDIVEQIIMLGRDVPRFTSELTEHFRNLLVAATINKPSTALDISVENINKLKAQSKTIPATYLIDLINRFSDLQAQLKYASNARILLEVLLIRLCNPVLNDTADSMTERIMKLENMLKDGVPTISALPKIETTPAEPVVKKQKTLPPASLDDFKMIKDKWSEIMASFDISTRALLNDCSVDFLSDNFLYIICESLGVQDQVNKNKLEVIKYHITEVCGKSVELKTMLKEAFQLEKSGLNFEAATVDSAINELYDKFKDVDRSIIEFN